MKNLNVQKQIVLIATRIINIFMKGNLKTPTDVKNERKKWQKLPFLCYLKGLF